MGNNIKGAYDQSLAAFDHDAVADSVKVQVVEDLMSAFDRDDLANPLYFSKAQNLAFKMGYKAAQLQDYFGKGIKKLVEPTEQEVAQ